MEIPPEDLAVRQDRILTACNQPNRVHIVWNTNYRDGVTEPTDIRAEICHSIEKYWSKHMRFLNRHINTLCVELKSSIDMMRSNPDLWKQSQISASGRVNAAKEVLNISIGTFIDAIGDINQDSLRIGRSRSSNLPLTQETAAEIETDLKLAEMSISDNVDRVTDQVDALNLATASYNIINPGTTGNPDSQTNGGDSRPANSSQNPRPTKFDPKESFLNSLKGKQFIDSSTCVCDEENMEILESYLLSGGAAPDTNIVERFAFQVMDSPSKADYRVMKQKMLMRKLL